MDKPLAWGDAQTVKYLSEKLTESHQAHSALIRERDMYQVQYQVLRDLALEMVAAWGNGNDEERLIGRFKDVLGLSVEDTQLDEHPS